MNAKGVILLLVSMLALPAAGMADEGRVSLKEAVELAMTRNHLLKAAAYDQLAAEHGTAVSRSRYLPRIFLEETAAVTNEPTRVFMMKLDEGRFTQNDFLVDNLNHPATHGDFGTQFSLEQPLLDFGIGHDVEMARREEAAQRQAIEKRREDVALRVVTAYLEVQKATAQIEATDKALQAAREQQRLATVRSAEGTGLKSDELRARTFLAEVEQQSITARNGRTLAKMRLAQATGGETGDALDVTGNAAALPLTLSRGDLENLALGSRPDLKEQEQQAHRAEAAVDKARSAYLPTVYAGAAYRMNDRDIPFGRDNDGWVAGATLHWELFDGLRRGNELAKARARQQSAAESLKDYRQEIALQVTESYLRREESGQRLAVARHALADAEEGVRLISRRFENSLATMADLLDAQTALNRTRASLVENESDFALATAQLYYAAGVLLKEVMQ
jgi:outer membrane protein TolC